MNFTRRFAFAAAVAAVTLTGAQAQAASASELAARGQASLNNLYSVSPRSRLFAHHALAVLVFPRIYKAGFVVGAQTGDGVLFVRGRPTAYYNISAASFGLQAGGQAFSSAMYFMNRRALGYLHSSSGWALGSTPNIVVVDVGAAATANTTNLTQDVYIFNYAAKGLMAGIDLHASKITEIHPN